MSRQIHFPSDVSIRHFTPRLVGQRLDDFVNVDGEPFARPSLSAHWRIDADLVAHGRRGFLALSAFITEMQGNASSVLPLANPWVPAGFTIHQGPAPDYGPDSTGFNGAGYEGIKLDGAMAARDSFINIKMSRVFQLYPGMIFSIGDHMHQIRSFSHRNESDTKFQLRIAPNLREGAANNAVVSFDRPRLKVRMERGTEPRWTQVAVAEASCTFVEAF